MSKRPRTNYQDNHLLAAIKQLALILKDDGQPYETHAVMANNWLTAHNQVLGMGIKIAEDLRACPNAYLLKEALSKCGDTFSITDLQTKLSIASGKFRAQVPCIPPENLSPALPDAPCALIDNKLRDAIAALAPLATEGLDRIVTASFLINGGSVTATDARVIIQAWHGIDLPPELAIPKAAIDPILKNNKTFKAFGFSKSSATFYYEDDSWLKSQFYVDKWPDVAFILDKKVNLWPIPDGFYDALKALEPFSDNGCVYFDSNVMRSHQDESKGASYDVYGLPKGPAFQIKQLRMMEHFAKTVDFLVPHNGHRMAIFYGDNVRGAIAGRKE